MRGWSWHRFQLPRRFDGTDWTVSSWPVRGRVEQASGESWDTVPGRYILDHRSIRSFIPRSIEEEARVVKRGYKLKRHARWRRWRIRVYTIYIKSKPLVCRILSDGFHFSPTVQNCKKSHTTSVFIPRSFQVWSLTTWIHPQMYLLFFSLHDVLVGYVEEECFVFSTILSW
jgi:hypothetical protein